MDMLSTDRLVLTHNGELTASGTSLDFGVGCDCDCTVITGVFELGNNTFVHSRLLLSEFECYTRLFA